MILELDEHSASLPSPLTALVITDSPPPPHIPPNTPCVSPDTSPPPLTHAFSYTTPHTPPQRLRSRVEQISPQQTVTKFHINYDADTYTCALPPGSDVTAAAAAAATLLRFHFNLPMNAIIDAIQRVTSHISAHFDIVSRAPLAVHDVRTYPHTIRRAIDDLFALGARHVHILFRPYPPTFDLSPLPLWVALLSSPHTSLSLLPDYHDPDAPRAASLRSAIPTATTTHDAPPHAALLAIGGDDLRSLLLSMLPTPSPPTTP
jgi:hypothetical protein